MLGFALFYNNLLSGDFYRSRLYRKCTRKQMMLEMLDDEKMWGKEKDYEGRRAGLITSWGTT